VIPLANYRPKSLDELNSFYDKTLSSQNVIKDTASTINTNAFAEEEVVSSQSIDDFFAEQADFSTGNCADLTGDIQSFIANFGKPATKEDEIAIRRRPTPIKVRNMPTPPKPMKFADEDTPVPEEAAPVEAVQQEAPEKEEAKPEKTEFVITAEKNELFEEYMRIMSDEDDDREYSKSRVRKRKKSRKAQNTEAEVTDTADTATESIGSAPEIEKKSDSVFEIADDAESFTSFTDDAEQEPDNAPEVLHSKEENDLSDLFTDDEEPEEKKQPRKKTALQLILFFVLFVTLLAALAVTTLQVVVKVNSGEAFADNYYIYTSDTTDTVADINEGDLIIVENTVAEKGEVFAYRTKEGISFAVKSFSPEPEFTSGRNSTNENIKIFNKDLKGKVKYIYPSLGAVAAVITENFMTVIVSLLVVAVLIILLLIFAFRHSAKGEKDSSKDNFSFDEQEDYDETSDEDFTLTESKK